MLLDFLRLVRRRKLAETQRVGAQLAGAEADLEEAKRRLAVVHFGSAHASPHPAAHDGAAEVGVLPSPCAAQSAAAEAAAGGRKRRRDEEWLSGVDRADGAAALSHSLSAAPAKAGRSPTLSTAANLRGLSTVTAAASPSPLEPAPQTPPALQRAAARVLAAFPVVDEVYAVRRARCSAASQGLALNCKPCSTPASAAHESGEPRWPPPVRAASPPVDAAGAPVAGPSGAEAAGAGKRACAPAAAGDHLTLFGQDLTAFTRYSELKVCLGLSFPV